MFTCKHTNNICKYKIYKSTYDNPEDLCEKCGGKVSFLPRRKYKTIEEALEHCCEQTREFALSSEKRRNEFFTFVNKDTYFCRNCLNKQLEKSKNMTLEERIESGCSSVAEALEECLKFRSSMVANIEECGPSCPRFCDLKKLKS